MERIVFRGYEEKDLKPIIRIWQEVGWLEQEPEVIMKEIIPETRNVISVVNGSVEGAVMVTPGELFYQKEKIKAHMVNAVTISLVARRLGLAAKSLAQLLAKEATAGIPLSFLGMFEQGYYNKLGFGNGSYFRHLHFDPADLDIRVKCGIPKRLSLKDYKAVHKNRLNRMKLHGNFNVNSDIATKSEMRFMKKSFGLGYFNEKGKLTHHIWINPREQEFGPWSIEWQAYESREQFLELMALLSSFGDQVRSINMTEPANVQLTDFIKKPIRNKGIRKGGKYENYLNSYPYWQFRMLNPSACLKKTHLQCESLEFNLLLEDPVEKYLEKKSGWQGCSGEYYVKLGEESLLEKGYRKNLPLLKAGIGAFSRMWLGVKPASGLSISDNLWADDDLLEKLDHAFRLPEPHPDWWF